MSKVGAIRDMLRLVHVSPGPVECPRCHQGSEQTPMSPCVYQVDDTGAAFDHLYHLERRNLALNRAFAAYCEIAGVDVDINRG